MNDKDKEKPLLDEYIINPSAVPFDRTPNTCIEMINAYGTYEIQPTADNESDFPAIAQGTPKQWRERPLKFFRNGDDINPAADFSDEKSI